MKETQSNMYHGIVFNIAQKNKSVFNDLNIIGLKKVFGGLLTIYKISVPKDELHKVIQLLQNNMAEKLLFIKQQFYVHFYESDELIIVFKKKIFKATTDKISWGDAINYGKSLKVKENQLDFQPCRFQDETF